MGPQTPQPMQQDVATKQQFQQALQQQLPSSQPATSPQLNLMSVLQNLGSFLQSKQVYNSSPEGNTTGQKLQAGFDKYKAGQ